MNNELTIAADLSLPLELVTETIAILAKKGARKSYAASVLAEEMLGAGAHVVVIDSPGVWWGLRAGADGDPAEGLPIVIVGGDHADLPLDPSQGAAVADLVVVERVSCVPDVRRLPRREVIRFLTAFLTRLYETNRDALHLIVDEADLVVPQMPGADGQQLLEAMDNIVRRGRSAGLGCTLITQRPAVLNKNVLTQVEVLLAMRLTGSPDRKAIGEWFAAHGSDAERKAVAESLATLGVGEGWFWSPNILGGVLRRIRTRRRRTFDSSATPKVGEAVREPLALANVDMASLAARFASQLDAAKENDVEVLKARIADLKRQVLLASPPERVEIAVKSAKLVLPEIVERIVEVPVLAAGEVDRLGDMRDSMVGTAKDLMNMAGEITARLAAFVPFAASPSGAAEKADAPAPVSPAPRPRPTSRRAVISPVLTLATNDLAIPPTQPMQPISLSWEGARGDPQLTSGSQDVSTVTGGGDAATNDPSNVFSSKRYNVTTLQRPFTENPFASARENAPHFSAPEKPPRAIPLDNSQRKLINALASFAALGVRCVSRENAATWAGYSADGGRFAAITRDLKKMGMITYPTPGELALTDAGAAAADPVVSRPRGRTCTGRGCPASPVPQQRMLSELLKVYPKGLTRDALAARLDLSSSGGSFAENVRELKNLGLAGYPRSGSVAATLLLFSEGLA